MAQNTPNLTTIKRTIAAGSTSSFNRVGEFITVISASAPFKMKIDNGPAFDMQTGITVKFPDQFLRAEILETEGAPNTVELFVGKGDVTDARLVLSGQIATREGAPDLLTTPAPVSALNAAVTVLAVANSFRRQAVLVNSDAAATIYIGGDAGAVAGQGLPLAAGQSLVLDTGAAIYARNDSGAAVAVAVAELEWTA